MLLARTQQDLPETHHFIGWAREFKTILSHIISDADRQP